MTASLSREDVSAVAVLARLQLSPEEVDVFTSQLGQILEYVDILNEVDTTDIEPLAHPIPVTNVFRDDIVTPSLPREAALSNAPNTDGKYFFVPQILEEQ